MMRLNIAIDYLGNCPEFAGELARLSWKEWQDVYQQRKQTFEDSLKNYRDRMNTDRVPRRLLRSEPDWRQTAGNSWGWCHSSFTIWIPGRIWTHG
jgi:hypothetical protein